MQLPPSFFWKGNRGRSVRLGDTRQCRSVTGKCQSTGDDTRDNKMPGSCCPRWVCFPVYTSGCVATGQGSRRSCRVSAPSPQLLSPGPKGRAPVQRGRLLQEPATQHSARCRRDGWRSPCPPPPPPRDPQLPRAGVSGAPTALERGQQMRRGVGEELLLLGRRGTDGERDFIKIPKGLGCPCCQKASVPREKLFRSDVVG